MASPGLTRSQLWNYAENQKQEHHHRNKSEVTVKAGLVLTKETDCIPDWIPKKKKTWRVENDLAQNCDGQASQDEPNLGGGLTCCQG